MQSPPPRFRLARPLIYASAVIAAVSIAVTAALDPIGQRLITARELFGLWALGLLLASLMIGPLFSVLPRLPLRSFLMYGRRALGITTFLFAVLHVGCYFWPLLGARWRELFTPGAVWVVGLGIGMLAMTNMAALAFTSTDATVKRLGGRRWKRLHRTVYVLLVMVLAHAVLVGADFGVTRPPDVRGPPDAGALFGFACVALAWAVLFYLRKRGWKWMSGTVARPNR